MNNKHKICKGINKASSFPGCGGKSKSRKYGLCPGCLKEFLLNTEIGREIILKTSLRAKKNVTLHRKKQIREKKKKLKTWKDHVKDLERIFNEFIRLRDKDKPCISCDKAPGTYKLTAGHFWPTTYQYLRFNEDNVHGQCWYYCNKNKRGNLGEYRPRLIEKIGLERVEQLDNDRHKKLELTIPQMQELKQEYRKKIKELKKKL